MACFYNSADCSGNIPEVLDFCFFTYLPIYLAKLFLGTSFIVLSLCLLELFVFDKIIPLSGIKTR